MRKPTLYGFDGVKEILLPIAKKLLKEKMSYPITLIYMKLKFCGAAYKLFDQFFKEEQYVGGIKSPTTRLFNQFHAPLTSTMKANILQEIKSEKSRIRVIFATTALGMGVDARNVNHVIHIGPPSSIESYVQELGRAGRRENDSWATLYWNYSDISSNTHVEKSVREYCLTQTCLRKLLLDYFGYPSLKQERCCSNCHANLVPEVSQKKRNINTNNLKNLLDECLQKYSNECFGDCPMEFEYPDLPSSDVIIRNIDSIICEDDYL